ncbi:MULTISPECIES: LpxI family protein [Bartonella]|uniref:LpxI family protein n=1 Tax=Bartonella TaxID=773 RepID=UPI0018DE38F4|nr:MULTISPECIES: UDP-2,3-diacylglucosamine diphosphatase LpxI [Bartonella]MBH9975291.1 UDP-2,3-diacylglucosamine diphosphatase LpxI [Bartonella choladocola]MBI0014898.1 UDP-2,3-diacylglucosamine diphosphatase LpxI [Bartonella sp. B10834G3]
MGKGDTKRSLSGRTAIIAGNGVLPLAVAKAIQERGEKPFLVPLKGEADSSLYNFDHCEISVVQLAKLIKALKKADVKNVILAGGVKSRPNLADLRPDWTTISALPKLFRALGQGDDALLKAFISVVEKYGFHVVGAHEVVPQLLAPIGFNLTKKRANDKNWRDIMLAAKAAAILGKLDIGQGAVAVRGRVVAVEGAEGTDNMLRRIKEMREEKRIPPIGGVLVKRTKAQQDERADLPTIGPETIIRAKECLLEGVAVEAGRTFIVSLKETVEQADKSSMFIETFGKNDYV